MNKNKKFKSKERYRDVETASPFRDTLSVIQREGFWVRRDWALLAEVL
jgi:hypothetical protein